VEEKKRLEGEDQKAGDQKAGDGCVSQWRWGWLKVEGEGF